MAIADAAALLESVGFTGSGTLRSPNPSALTDHARLTSAPSGLLVFPVFFFLRGGD